MEGERYVVELDLKRVGDFNVRGLTGGIEKAETATQRLRKGWDGFKGATEPLVGALDTVVGKAWEFAKVGAMAGGAAIFAGATYGVVNLNNELEKATISLGTIFSANGMAANVPAGMVAAKSLISQMRVDAQKLPGEFSDLMTIFTTGAIPAFRSGASIQQFRGMAGQAMAAGKVAQMDNGQVAREFAQLLEGRAGSHNVFGMKLMGLSGNSATKFNAMSSDKRLAMIEKELSKYSGAIDAFGNSFDAQSSTLVDNFKTFGIKATSSLFIHVKDTMKEANDWFTNHQAEADSFAVKWGSRLVSGFESGKHVVMEYGPLLIKAAEGAYQKFTAIWIDVQPYAEKFGAVVKAALADPNGTIDKLITLAKLWAGLKIGGALLGGVGDDIAKGGLGGGLKGMGMRGGAALAGYGVGDAALNGPSGGSIAATIAGFTLMGSSFGPLGAAAGAAAGSLVALGQSIDARSDAEAAQVDVIGQGVDSIVQHYSNLGASSQQISTMLQVEANNIRSAGDDTAAALFEAAAEVRMADFAIEQHGNKVMDEIGSWWSQAKTVVPATPPADQAKAKPPDPKHKGGGGGIQKVEIVVTNNNNPSRVARVITGHLVRLSRNSGQSPDVRNYSALEDG